MSKRYMLTAFAVFLVALPLTFINIFAQPLITDSNLKIEHVFGAQFKPTREASGAISFERNVTTAIKEKYSKTHNIVVQPKIGFHDLFRPDLLMVDKKNNAVIVDIKYVLPKSQLQIDTLRTLIAYTERRGFKSVSMWLIVPSHASKTIGKLPKLPYHEIKIKLFEEGRLIDLAP